MNENGEGQKKIREGQYAKYRNGASANPYYRRAPGASQTNANGRQYLRANERGIRENTYFDAEKQRRAEAQERYRAAKRRVTVNRIIFGSVLALVLILLIVIISKCSGKPENTEIESENMNGAQPVGAETENENEDAGKADGKGAVSEPIKICIDPGHGYDDPGTGEGSKYMGDLHEKDLNLAIGLKTYDLLVSKGYDVIITHKDDEKPESYGNAQYLFGVKKRMEWVEEQGGVNVFVSIHCNAYPQDESVRGIRVYYCKDNVEGAGRLADSLADAVYNTLGLSSVPSVTAYNKSKAFYVTKALDIPAVLIEAGFVTNKDDIRNLKDEAWQNKMAAGIVKGIENYISGN